MPTAITMGSPLDVALEELAQIGYPTWDGETCQLEDTDIPIVRGILGKCGHHYRITRIPQSEINNRPQW